MKIVLSLLTVLLCLSAQPAAAQSPFPGGGGAATSAPIDISAQDSLEWRQEARQYVAKGDVVVKQGGFTLQSQTLTADYEGDTTAGPGAAGGTNITLLTAEGNVRLSDDGLSATGEKAVYDTRTGQLTLTGGDLKLVTPDQTVTARDSLQYNTQTGQALAVGNAVAISGTDKIRADRLTAQFGPDSGTDAARTLQSLSGTGSVVITTPDEVLRGDQGTYDARTNTATLTGTVKLTRGPNVLEGHRATVDLNTNVSRMEGGPADGGRVRALFYPGSNNAAPPANTQGTTTP